MEYCIVHQTSEFIDEVFHLKNEQKQQHAEAINNLPHIAVITQRIDVIQRLFQQEIPLDLKDENGNTALHLAANFNSNVEIVRFLLDNGAEKKKIGQFGRNAFLCACAKNTNLEIVKLFYEDESDLTTTDEDGDTALHIAAYFNSSVRVVGYLLKIGSDTNKVNNFGNTPYQSASKYNKNIDVVEFLRDKTIQ